VAQPPLEHQIEHLDRILVCATGADGAYVVEEALKGSRGPSTFKPDVEIFKRLGYVPIVGERAVLFANAAGQVVELLPVKDGWVDYAPSDAPVRRRLALRELEALVRGPASRAPGIREKSRTAFWVLTLFAGLAVLLALREIASSREAARLFETGARVTGRCEGLSPKPPARISYRFDVAGASYETFHRSVRPEEREKLKVGQPIEVYYDPARPSRNVSEPERSIQGATSLGVFLLFGVAAAFFAGGLYLLRVGGRADAHRR
jgi:hypothetical protein